MIRLRINQPTPCGGAYSELFYLNDPIENKNLPTITVIIQEYDAIAINEDTLSFRPSRDVFF